MDVKTDGAGRLFACPVLRAFTPPDFAPFFSLPLVSSRATRENGFSVAPFSGSGEATGAKQANLRAARQPELEPTGQGGVGDRRPGFLPLQLTRRTRGRPSWLPDWRSLDNRGPVWSDLDESNVEVEGPIRGNACKPPKIVGS
ncbi:hypothetical protein GGTG_04241 [Gaeumannomyces tritici R3-111a-1]|uniref:Uncharacterized protein n=1 Tax=Gaeumannomyces tritici (strain R3-111a-1) TaxID=644352 RepID=J3NSJ0_GAET3|nr:hypothetical protein GGTG_04241 [Gaeumannomyces tritici R3-111a-1]EJT79153.1 hypothetical protein GGTG_04241 [Gaeumannomyces tritici R3-111a-1]